MVKKNKIKLIIVDDHPMVRFGLKRYIQNCNEIFLLGEMDTGEKCIRYCEKNLPDVILMDIMLPKMDGIKTTFHILKKWPDVKIIILTSFINNDLIQRSLKAGAIGYFLKNESGKTIVSGIRDAFNGKINLSSEATKAMVSEIKDPLSKRFQLTKQEQNILALIAEGLSNKEIAKRLYLSTSTIQFHVSNIFTKLGTSKRTAAVYIALKNNLVKSPSPN